ncbi:MAG: rod shape-determining protein [Pyrinomonadaceae bacterium MAG19_C2-C3]|nr:rod shape-determining protein [Pyrinomonadaceae bacterium MAG19_C2-C3]
MAQKKEAKHGDKRAVKHTVATPPDKRATATPRTPADDKEILARRVTNAKPDAAQPIKAEQENESNSRGLARGALFVGASAAASYLLMRRKRSQKLITTIRDLVSDSLAIDMGSASTIIAVRGRGVVVDEPSVVAVKKLSGEPLAFGREAQEMLGREARDVQIISPLIDGVVADFERTQAMLEHFVREARSGFSQFSRRAVMSVLAGVTHVEQRALLAAAEQAHIGRVHMVEEGLAAAIGAGVMMDDIRANVVIDIGGGTTNIAVVAGGAIVYADGERLGSTDIDLAIIDRLRRHRGLIIGVSTAERLKLELCSAIEPTTGDESRVTVKGRDVQTGSPGAIEVTAHEIYTVAQPILRRIADKVRDALGEVPPEVSADIYDRGIILTGGGALLDGIEIYLQQTTQLGVRIADEPRFAIVRGLAQLYDEPLLLRRVARNEFSPAMNETAGAFEG